MTTRSLNENSPPKKTLINKLALIAAILIDVFLLTFIIYLAISISLSQKSMAELTTDSYWLKQYFLDVNNRLKLFLYFLIAQFVCASVVVVLLIIDEKTHRGLKRISLIIFASLNVAIPLITPAIRKLEYSWSFSLSSKISHIIDCLLSIVLLILIIIYIQNKKEIL